MFAALKKIFSRRASNREAPPSPPPAPPITASPSPAAAPRLPRVRPETPPPAPTKPAPTPLTNLAGPPFPSTPARGAKAVPIPAPPSPPLEPSGAVEMVNLPLAPLLHALPAPIQLGVLHHPRAEALLPLPLAILLPQLGAGVVKITFGQLRNACPPNTFRESNALDQTVVQIPLDMVLAHLKPGQLKRRQDQKKAVVPGDDEAVFAKQTLAGITAPPLRLSSAAPPPPPMPPSPVPPASPQPPSKPAFAVAPEPAMAAQIPKAAPLPKVEPQTSRTPPPDGEIVVPMAVLVNIWPESIRHVLVQPHVAPGLLHLPIKDLADTLKTGKLVFTWKQLRGWIKPEPPAGEALDDTQVNLPLNLIVPLFLAKRGPLPAGQKRATAAENIPNLFSTGPAAAPSQKAAVAPAPAPVAQPSVVEPAPHRLPPQPAAAPAAPEPARAAAQPVEAMDIGAIFGHPGQRAWTPVEIVHKTAGLPGVAGALIALQDGLLVAGQMPSGLNAETIAAFLPQMFGRMAHYTRELKLGEPGNVAIELHDHSMQIFKTGNVYFLAMGRAGEAMPGLQLGAIAAQLERQSKPN